MSGTEVITRRSRAGRQQQDEPEDERPSVTIEQPDQISPEDALAESRRQLQASQQQTAEARRQARAAQQQAQHATTQAQEATTARISDREIAVNSVLESAKAEQATARAAKRLAREAGDLDAEMAAEEMFTVATTRMHNATAEIERIKAAPKPKPPEQQAPTATPETQRWMDEHPAYHTDRRYQALANATHFEAIEAGHPVESPGYFDYVNNALAEVYGEDHGQTGGQKPVPQQQTQRRQQPVAREGDGLPPSRQTGGGQGGYKTLDTPLGSVQFRQGRDGKIESIRFANTATADNFKEGAETSFRRLYETNPDQALADFATETIHEYLEGGETIKHGDGRILR